MELDVIVGNHQSVVAIPLHWLTALEQIANRAASEALAHATLPDSPLADLGTLEISLVDDETSDRVHRDFMNIPGSTDVITFHHGEIVVGVEVALRQAAEFHEPFGRELLRYIVHGILHLAGHEDADLQNREKMEAAQEEIVAAIWRDGLADRMNNGHLSDL